ncbi:Actin-related protein 7 [Bienertia sinuspersici]
MSIHHLKPPGSAIHITALDGIIHVNSIFTLAVFVGLSWNPNDPSHTLITDPSCSSLNTSVAENLVAFHVFSFSSFLFSSLVALGLKQAFRISAHYDSHWAFIHTSGLRLGMLVSAIGSVSGCAFLMLALVNVAQIKLGNYTKM